MLGVLQRFKCQMTCFWVKECDSLKWIMSLAKRLLRGEAGVEIALMVSFHLLVIEFNTIQYLFNCLFNYGTYEPCLKGFDLSF